MPVTQQLARLSLAQLVVCRRSVEELDKLCSFELLPSSDYLDLDWAPSPLKRALALAQASASTLHGLQRALAGDAEINPAYRDVDDTIWEHPVTALDPEAVAEVAVVLGQVEPAKTLAVLPEDSTAAVAILHIGELGEHPRTYLQRHLVALQDFYAQAARRRLGVALWWD